MNNWLRWSSQVYRVMLYAYPQQFRAEYGEEMLWFYEDFCRDTLNERGAGGVLLFWMSLVSDWGITVVKERLLSVGYKGAKNMDTTKFNTQLTSTFAVFSRTLRSGYNVLQSLEIIAENAPEPTRSAVQKVLNNVEEGANLLDAMSALEGEIQSPQLTRFMDEIRAQLQEGGNLADRLDAVNREVVSELGDNGWAKHVDLNDGYDFNEHYPLN